MFFETTRSIRPEYLKSLDVVGLSWLTRLCNIAWQSGTVPLDWQTGVVVPLFKKGDQSVCSNFRGIDLCCRAWLLPPWRPSATTITAISSRLI